MFIEFSRFNFLASSSPVPDYGDNLDYSDNVKEAADRPKIVQTRTQIRKKGHSLEDEEWFEQQKMKAKKNETLYYPCDKKSDLYVLQQDFILHNRGHLDNGSR